MVSEANRHGWRLVQVGEVARVVTGTTPSSKDHDNWGVGVPFLTPTDMSDFDYDPTAARRLSADCAARNHKRIVPPGSVAVSCIATLGKVARIAVPTLTNQQINTMVPHAGILDGDFAFYWATNIAAQLDMVAAGSVARIVNKSVFSRISAWLPPFDEQVAIAQTLTPIDELVKEAESLSSVRRELMDLLLSGLVAPRQVT